MLKRMTDDESDPPADHGTRARQSLLPLEVRGLILERGGRRLIDHLDLTIQSQMVTVILGANGSGKTLLLRLLHGLIAPTAGRITWGGEGLAKAVRLRQAMVFQRPVLLRRSVAANVDFALRLRGKRSSARRDALLDHVGLAAMARQPARLLSGGEQHEPWPACDEAFLRDDEIELPVQINGKVRAKIMVSPDLNKDDLESAAKESPEVAKLLDGKNVVKTIAVPKRLVNFVVK